MINFYRLHKNSDCFLPEEYQAPEAAKAVLDQYPVLMNHNPTPIAHALSIHANAFFTVIFDGDTRDCLAHLSYHRTQKKFQHKEYRDGPSTSNEEAALGFNRFLQNIRIFGFDRTAAVYNTTYDNQVRNSEIDAVKNNVFHIHFGKRPTYVMEFQISRDDQTIIVTNIGPHKGFPFAKKLLNITDYQEQVQAARFKTREALNKKYTYADCVTDLHQCHEKTGGTAPDKEGLRAWVRKLG
jgi:hypothetical protein